VLVPPGGWSSGISRHFETSFEGEEFSAVIAAVSDDRPPYRTLTLMLFEVEYMEMDNRVVVKQEM